MDISKVKRCRYNPRSMSSSARDGLRESMEDFGDISGICINSRTDNVFAGNHRFDEIAKKYGRSKLVLTLLEDEWYSLDVSGGKTTGFKVRVVDWDLEKEQLANIVANNDLITGEYNTSLQPLLKKIKLSVPKVKMDSLRVSPMVLDDELEDIDLDEEFETPEIVKDKSKEKSLEVKEPEIKDIQENVREIVSNIKVVAPSELIEEIKFDILEALSKKEYYDKVNIIGS